VQCGAGCAADLRLPCSTRTRSRLTTTPVLGGEGQRWIEYAERGAGFGGQGSDRARRLQSPLLLHKARRPLRHRAGLAEPAWERSLSSFDQRHALKVQAQYTSGEGWWRHTDERMTGQAAEGMDCAHPDRGGQRFPLTPVYRGGGAGTGYTGRSGRPYRCANCQRLSRSALNPLAYTPPATGQWGTAGRNSITGPASSRSTQRWLAPFGQVDGCFSMRRWRPPMC